MRRLMALALAGLIVLAAGVWAMARPGGERPDSPAALLSTAEAAGQDGQVDVADATDFDWDRLHIFDAYVTADQVAAATDGWTPLSPAERLVWGDLFLAYDGRQLLAFVHDGEVVAWTNLNTAEPPLPYLNFLAARAVAVVRDRMGLPVLGTSGGGLGLDPRGRRRQWSNVAE